MGNSFAITVLEDFVALIYPRYCLACEDALVKGEKWICTRCILEMPCTNYHHEKENPLYQRFQGRMPLKYAVALYKFIKGSRVQHVLHALKYKSKPELGEWVGHVFGSELLAGGYQHEFDLIVPVPLHASRRRVRGYNQSEKFGQGLSQALQIPCSDSLVVRTSRTETQTRKTKLDRWENVGEVFKVTNLDGIQGKRILMVDDVVTTGATLEACGSTLLRNGCRDLSIACIAAA